MSWFSLREPHGNLELYALRIGFAIILVLQFPLLPDFPGQPLPNGLAEYLNLTGFSAQNQWWPLYAGLVVAIMLYCAGRLMILSTAYLFAMTVGAGTLYNSQGDIHHSTQIFSLILLGQLVAYVWLGVRSWVGRPKRLPAGCRAHDLAVHFSYQMIASVYVVAALSKFIRTNGLWPLLSPGFAMEVEKTMAQAHYSFFDPSLLERGKMISELILTYPYLVQLLFAGVLLIELGAFLALWGRRARFVAGLMLILLHQGINMMTAISFTSSQLLVALFFLSIPFWLARRIHAWM